MHQTRRRWLIYALLGLALAGGIAFKQTAPQVRAQFEQPVPVLADPGGSGGGAG